MSAPFPTLSDAGDTARLHMLLTFDKIFRRHSQKYSLDSFKNVLWTVLIFNLQRTRLLHIPLFKKVFTKLFSNTKILYFKI